MKHLYYYLSLEGRFEIVVAQAGTDRVGLLGASFTTATAAANYAIRLNSEAKIKPDSDTATD